MATTLGEHSRPLAAARAELVEAAAESDRGPVPSVVHFVLAAAGTVGQEEVAIVSREHLVWKAELGEVSGPALTRFRGVLLSPAQICTNACT